jgi:alpha-L-fucosidase
MVIRALLEYMARGGNYTVCISLTPDGDLDEGNQSLLREVGAWMRINGEGIYSSHNWKIIGEGETVGDANRTNQPVRLKPPPGRGGMGKAHAEFSFTEKDFRFTVGKDGSLYAWCMTLPKPGAELTIKSLGTKAKLFDGEIKSVALLGSKAKLDWKQTADGLVIQYPKSAKLKMAVGFKIR